MGMGVIRAPVDAATLSARAEQASDQSLKEDQKLNRSRKSAAASNQISKARENISETKKEADENLQAAKDKTDGGFLGLSLAALVLLVTAAICIFFPPASVVVMAGLIGGGVFAAGLANTLGQKIGDNNAEDNEEAASVAKENAGNADLMAKTYEKQTEDLKDAIKQVDAEAQSVRDNARKRRDDQQKIALKD